MRNILNQKENMKKNQENTEPKREYEKNKCEKNPEPKKENCKQMHSKNKKCLNRVDISSENKARPLFHLLSASSVLLQGQRKNI